MSASFEALVGYVQSCMEDERDRSSPWDTDITIHEAEAVVNHIFNRKDWKDLHDAKGVLTICKFPIARNCQDGNARLLKAALNPMDIEQLQHFEAGCRDDIDWWDWHQKDIPYPDEVLYAICSTDKIEFIASMNIREWQGPLEWKPDEKYAGVDAYWSACIRYRIAKKDWLRAWDDLRHALLGFPDNPQVPLRQYGQWSSSWGPERTRKERSMFCIDQVICRQLIQDVFGAMCHEGIISENPRNHLHQGVPGMLEATALEERHTKPESAMVIEIATWAKSKKSEKRQSRIKKRMDPKS